MTVLRNQKGSMHIVAVLVVALVAVVGFAGYRVLNTNKDDKTASSSESAQVPDKIQSKTDIEQASTALDTDGADNSMDPSQLDSDLNDLL